MRLFLAADPREFIGFMRFCKDLRREQLPVHWAYSGLFQDQPMLAIANGAGPLRAFAAVAGPQLEMVCNLGFCGALDPQLRVADIVVGTTINGEKIDAPRSEMNHQRGGIASVNRVIRWKAEKKDLFESGAIAVEMEAAGALKRARTAGVPFFCVRAVSDRADEDLNCDFNRALRDDGRFGVWSLALDALLHPFTSLPELIRLGKRTEIATERLGEFLASCEF